MKILICGSVGYGGKEEIKELQKILRDKHFEVLDQLTLDYSQIDDFREAKELCEEIVEHDLKYCDEADVIVLLASRPSFGAMGEAVISSMKGKVVVTYSPEKVRSPWPIKFSNYVAKTRSELISILRSIEPPEIRVIPNVYGRHEATFVYDKFTCICPVTGEVDRAKIEIRYVPRKYLIEYESLDNYFKKFAGKRMHHESVVSKVFHDIIKAIDPEELEVKAEFEERSNVKAIIRIRTSQPERFQ